MTIDLTEAEIKSIVAALVSEIDRLVVAGVHERNRHGRDSTTEKRKALVTLINKLAE